eukprot:3136186-Rhodomonas_salina.2
MKPQPAACCDCSEGPLCDVEAPPRSQLGFWLRQRRDAEDRLFFGCIRLPAVLRLPVDRDARVPNADDVPLYALPLGAPRGLLRRDILGWMSDRDDLACCGRGTKGPLWMALLGRACPHTARDSKTASASINQFAFTLGIADGFQAYTR